MIPRRRMFPMGTLLLVKAVALDHSSGLGGLQLDDVPRGLSSRSSSVDEDGRAHVEMSPSGGTAGLMRRQYGDSSSTLSPDAPKAASLADERALLTRRMFEHTLEAVGNECSGCPASYKVSVTTPKQVSLCVEHAQARLRTARAAAHCPNVADQSRTITLTNLDSPNLAIIDGIDVKMKVEVKDGNGVCIKRQIHCDYEFGSPATGQPLDGEIASYPGSTASGGTDDRALHMHLKLDPIGTTACSVMTGADASGNAPATITCSSAAFIEQGGSRAQIKYQMGHRQELLDIAIAQGKARFKRLEKLSDAEKVSLPVAYDPRIEYPQCFPDSMVFEQGDCGACWVFSSVGSASDRMCIKEAKEDPCDDAESSFVELDDDTKPQNRTPGEKPKAQKRRKRDSAGLSQDEKAKRRRAKDPEDDETEKDIGDILAPKSHLVEDGFGDEKHGKQGGSYYGDEGADTGGDYYADAGGGGGSPSGGGDYHGGAYGGAPAAGGAPAGGDYYGGGPAPGAAAAPAAGDDYYGGADKATEQFAAAPADDYYYGNEKAPETARKKPKRGPDEGENFPEGRKPEKAETKGTAEKKPTSEYVASTPAKAGFNSMAPGCKYRVQWSVQQLLSCIAPLEMNGVMYQMGCSGGHYQFAFDQMMGGILVDTDNEYGAFGGPEAPPWDGSCAASEFGRYRVTDFATYQFDDDDMYAVRKELYENGPVYTAFDVYTDFFDYDFSNYRAYKRTEASGDFMGGHAAITIGFGETANAERYFLIRNSWGPQWGDKGHFRMLESYKTSCLALTPNDHCLLDFGGAIVERIPDKVPANQWIALEWAECSTTCGEGGVQKREVLCVDEKGRDAKGCVGPQKPNETRTCGDDVCPACDWKKVPGGSIEGLGPGGDTEKYHLKDAKAKCTEAGKECGGITCTGQMEFMRCQLRVGPTVADSLEGEDSYLKDCSRMEVEEGIAEGETMGGGNKELQPMCATSDWQPWGTCCAELKQRVRSLVDAEGCMDLVPPLVQDEDCVNPDCTVRKARLETKGRTVGIVNLEPNVTRRRNRTKPPAEDVLDTFTKMIPEGKALTIIKWSAFGGLIGIGLALYAYVYYVVSTQKAGDKKKEEAKPAEEPKQSGGGSSASGSKSK